MYAAIELGGTKVLCRAVAGDGALVGERRFATTTPEGAIDEVCGAIESWCAGDPLRAVGVASFGPIGVDPAAPGFGRFLETPKPGWSRFDLRGALAARLAAPVAVDTDVNAAALAELELGAARGLDSAAYVTVGTGIGGGAIANGRPLHGLVHSELGHVRVPHDRQRDPFPGSCPFHGDCLEGLASGEALRQRWGAPGEELDRPEVWELEADYLALGLANVVLTLSPERLIVGGGVAGTPGLLALVRERLPQVLAGYLDAPQLHEGIDDYLVPPALGPRAGVLGAIELARGAA